MKLLKLRILPRGDRGWSSEELEFGSEITQIFGPNGVGKSPLIKSAMYCLGYPSKFREDIYTNCRYAELEFEINGTKFTSRRDFHPTELHVRLTTENGNSIEFQNELELSKYLLTALELEAPLLVSSNERTAASPYLSLILPIFYLDQDNGYRKFYSPENNFIKDQLSECIRIILGIPAKHPFNSKKDLIDSKRDLEAWDRSVYTIKKEYEAIEKIVKNLNKDKLESELSSLYKSLEDLQSSNADKSTSTDAIDEIISINNASIRSLERELEDYSKRQRSFENIYSEIQSEINTLNLNEEAKRIFTSFDEICSTTGCQLFSFSSDSYGKNLLYLKDQLKDIDRNVEIGKIRSDEIYRRKTELQSQTKGLIDKRNELINTSEIKSLVTAITQTSSKIFELEQNKKQFEIFDEISEKYTNALNSREAALTRKEELSQSGQTNPGIIKFRISLKENMLRWLDILDTSNISSDIRFQDDFIPILGNENLAQLSGSTSARVVLAYHAALLECFHELRRNKISFIILDTPKQHEMHGVDLGRYIDSLKVFSHATGVQVIISGTEYHYDGDQFDVEWTPKFPGKKQKMFLKQN